MAIRKGQGFRTALDLAAAIPSGRVTESVIQNIESGRRSDLSVSQLLEIAAALDVSPMFLLVPVGLPGAQVDLVNVGDPVAGMTAAEFADWVTQDESAPEAMVLPSGILANDLRIAWRSVRRASRMVRLLGERRSELRELEMTDADERRQKELREQCKFFEDELAFEVSYLPSRGIDVGWITAVLPPAEEAASA